MFSICLVGPSPSPILLPLCVSLFRLAMLFSAVLFSSLRLRLVVRRPRVRVPVMFSSKSLEPSGLFLRRSLAPSP
jgi:hypothetical protein